MFKFLKSFKNDNDIDSEMRELVTLLENDENIKVVGRGTVVRNLDSDEHRQRFKKTANELASKFALS